MFIKRCEITSVHSVSIILLFFIKLFGKYLWSNPPSRFVFFFFFANNKRGQRDHMSLYDLIMAKYIFKFNLLQKNKNYKNVQYISHSVGWSDTALPNIFYIDENYTYHTYSRLTYLFKKIEFDFISFIVLIINLIT